MRAGSPFEHTDHEVFVITAAHEGREGGQIATWVLPGSLIPDQPRVVAVLSPLNATFDLIWQSRRFAVTLLDEEQVELLPHFGLRSGRELDKLAGVPLHRTASGLPVPAGSCGFADCRLVSSLDGGDRMICLADVVEQRVAPAARPLRLREALRRLPADQRQALIEKRAREGELARALRPPR
jgi:flavin reductase (DIM6/NTAB) family NADH-FMN oxidoreductase RutF